MRFPVITRRTFVGGAASAAGFAALGGRALAQQPALPKSPVTLNIVDVAGNLALTQKAIENYRRAKPKLVSKITFTKAPAPELPGKIKAQQEAGRVDIDLVLTGTDGLSAGIDQKLWVAAAAGYAAEPAEARRHLPARRAPQMQELAEDQGVCVVYYPSGPLHRIHARRGEDAADDAPRSCWPGPRRNPNRFLYARPANSGPGRTFLMGLPYILGDKDPKDPVNGWDKTWAYLEELGKYVEYYPDRHRRDDEGAGRGLARHHRLDHRLGHQPARPRHRAEGGEGRHAQGLPLGHRRALHVRARRACPTRSSRCCST